jgi:pyruvate,water dikinase
VRPNSKTTVRPNQKKNSVILPIHKIKGQGGGKAKGLALLKKYGMNIPATWVVTGNTSDDELKQFVVSLPDDRAYAVRSSASGEDGEELSFAGQFDSFLNLKGEVEILKAVDECFASARSQVVKSYKEAMHSENGMSMNVIIQEMVYARYSGVLFTADPVDNRRDRISMSIVKGVGEGLMAGQESGENVVFYKARKDDHLCKLLSKELFNELVEGALKIEKEYGMPADLEWAVDKNGNLFWLQLRPVTGLKKAHFNELDDKPIYDKPVYTRGNIGEMMPGPVTPLTLSTFANAIDYGLQEFYHIIGALPDIKDERIFIHSYYNHLFFEVNSLYRFIPNVMLSKKENIDYSVVGEEVKGVELLPKAGSMKRLFNFIKMMRYLNGGEKAEKRLRKLYKEFRLDCPGDISGCYKLITENLAVLKKAWSLHYVSSSQSGSKYSMILNIYSKNKKPGREHQEKAAKYFNDIPDIESAQVLKAMDEMAVMLKNADNVKSSFLDADVTGAVEYLENKAPNEVKRAWRDFMERHGHRGVREGELYETEWGKDPSSIIEGIKSKLRLLLDGKDIRLPEKNEQKIIVDDDGLTSVQKRILKKMIPSARKAVARREQTKAQAIGVQYRFKQAYRHLGSMMAKEGLLDEPDQIFFLMHDEIGNLIKAGPGSPLKELSRQRMELYPEMKKLSFDDLSYGIPVPDESQPEIKNGNLAGIPVSHGVVEGRARLISKPEHAAKLKPGEIMVVEFTDIGWTPFYSVAGGLITEIGSPLSHGAVVAREYGLPTVVSVKGAMDTIKDGQKIKLDAVTGVVEVKVLNG